MEQATFAQLSVFRGSFTRQAAAEVVALPGKGPALLRVLAVLVNKSLLQFHKQTNRYQIHNLLRQYGAERLAEDGEMETAVYGRHSDYHCYAIRQIMTDYETQYTAALAAIEAIMDDAHAAWQWAAQRRQVEPLSLSLDGLCHFYWQRGRYQQGEAMGQLAIAHITPDEPAARNLLARLYVWQSRFAQVTGRQAAATNHLQQSLMLLEELPDDPNHNAAKAFAREQQGHLIVSADREQAQTVYREALALYQKAGDKQAQARLLSPLGTILRDSAHYDEAVKCYEQSIAFYRATGDLFGLGYALAELGSLHLLRNNPSDSEHFLKESLRIFRRLDDRASIAFALGILSMLFLNSGTIIESSMSLEKCIAVFKDMGNEMEVAFWTARLRFMYDLALGRYDEVRARAAENLPLFQRANHQLGLGFALMIQGWAELSQERFAQARPLLQQSVSLFRQLNQQDEVMRAVIGLGIIALHQGNLDQAKSFLYRALRLLVQREAWIGVTLAVPSIALVYIREDNVAEAVRLYELVRQSPTVANAIFYTDFAGRYIEAAAASLPPEAIDRAKRQGREQDFWPACRHLLEELRAAGWPEVDSKDSTGRLMSGEQNQRQTGAPIPSGRYVLQSMLAAGGMGEVYLAQDTVTGQQVAVKRLRPGLVQNPDSLARFVREGEALRRLNHPNIVKILDMVEDQESPLIVMEYVPGGDLRSLLQREGQLPIRQTLDIALEVADALARAHHLDVIHRDLKPANILLAQDGTPRLTDFGLVRLGDRKTRLTQAGSFMGTADYVSPEMCMGHEVDARSDIWALGIILFEMLTGDVPFSADFAPMVVVSIINSPLPDLQKRRPDAPPRLVALINQMLQKKPDNRLASARQAAAELELLRHESYRESRAQDIRVL